MSASSGKTYIGETPEKGKNAEWALKLAREAVTPLALRESQEALRDLEPDAAVAIAIGQMLGLNVGRDFEKEKKRKKRNSK